MTLTDARCRAEKPGHGRTKLSDGRGLQFSVEPNGTKLWQPVCQGKQKQIALGLYPDVSLCRARELPSWVPRRALANQAGGYAGPERASLPDAGGKVGGWFV